MNVVMTLRILPLLASLLWVIGAQAANDMAESDKSDSDCHDDTGESMPNFSEKSGGGGPVLLEAPLPTLPAEPPPDSVYQPALRGAPQSTVGAGARREEPLAMPVVDKP